MRRIPAWVPCRAGTGLPDYRIRNLVRQRGFCASAAVVSQQGFCAGAAVVSQHGRHSHKVPRRKRRRVVQKTRLCKGNARPRKTDYAKGMHVRGKRNAAPPGFFRNAAPPGRPGKPAETRKTKEINRKSKKNKGNQYNLKGKERGEREGAPGAPARFARVGAPILSPLSLFPSDCIDLLSFLSLFPSEIFRPVFGGGPVLTMPTF